MSFPALSQVHSCKCRQPVATIEATGVAIISDSEIVTGKLLGRFERLADTPAIRTPPTDTWLADLKTVLATFSPIERQAMRASPIDAAGQFNPWNAIAIDTLIERLESPWFPGMLNGGRLLSHLQPIARSADGTTFGFEALARAEIDGKLLNGGQIIDAARAHGAMFQFDQIGRTTAIRNCGPKLIAGEKLFINFIPMVIYDPALCLKSCWAAAQEAGVPLSSLVFEVVESEQFVIVRLVRLDTCEFNMSTTLQRVCGHEKKVNMRCEIQYENRMCKTRILRQQYYRNIFFCCLTQSEMTLVF